MPVPPRVLLHHPGGTRTPVDPCGIYYLEADADETLVRGRGARRLVDVRPLGELLPRFAPHGFARIHRSFAVNTAHVRNLRPRAKGGWELRLDPPVNRVLPVSDSHAHGLWQAFGEG